MAFAPDLLLINKKSLAELVAAVQQGSRVREE